MTPKDNRKIYIQIPAYRDSELPKTLEQVLGKANHPDLLRIGIAWQHDRQEKLPSKFLRNKNITVLDIPYQKSKGCNWARHLLQKQWKGEAYTLLLDSHHRFTKGWDELSLQMYHEVKQSGVAKPLLTAYLPSYDPDSDPMARMRTLLKIYYMDRTEGLLTRVTSYEVTGWKELKKPIPAQFISLHFLFTEGAFNREIPFDPAVYFFGDEVSIGLRSFTKGYQLFHPHRIIGWHAYSRKTRTSHWDDHSGWWVQNAGSLQKLRKIFTGNYKGKYGVGKNKSITQYEDLIGMPLYINA